MLSKFQLNLALFIFEKSGQTTLYFFAAFIKANIAPIS